MATDLCRSQIWSLRIVHFLVFLIPTLLCPFFQRLFADVCCQATCSLQVFPKITRLYFLNASKTNLVTTSLHRLFLGSSISKVNWNPLWIRHNHILHVFLITIAYWILRGFCPDLQFGRINRRSGKSRTKSNRLIAIV